MSRAPDETDEEEFFISSDDSMTRDILAGANNAEDFGFNPVEEATLRAMDIDYDEDDLDEAAMDRQQHWMFYREKLEERKDEIMQSFLNQMQEQERIPAFVRSLPRTGIMSPKTDAKKA
tara:strand:- start:495 stop:851 length:357 start_codon:yes stop_codon:yes gene_type:complete